MKAISFPLPPSTLHNKFIAVSIFYAWLLWIRYFIELIRSEHLHSKCSFILFPSLFTSIECLHSIQLPIWLLLLIALTILLHIDLHSIQWPQALNLNLTLIWKQSNYIQMFSHSYSESFKFDMEMKQKSKSLVTLKSLQFTDFSTPLYS